MDWSLLWYCEIHCFWSLDVWELAWLFCSCFFVCFCSVLFCVLVPALMSWENCLTFLLIFLLNKNCLFCIVLCTWPVFVFCLFLLLLFRKWAFKHSCFIKSSFFKSSFSRVHVICKQVTMFSGKIIDHHNCLETVFPSCKPTGGLLGDQVVLLLIRSSQSKLLIFSSVVFRLLKTWQKGLRW